MPDELPKNALQLVSLVTEDQTVQLSLQEVDVPEPGRDQVLIRVEAAPINPSDLGLLFAGADMAAAEAGGSPDRPVVTAPLPAAAFAALARRVGVPIPAGNEGAGTVVAAGDSPAAHSLLGKTVAVAGGAMYSQFRVADAAACLELPEGTPAPDGASSFVNPMTAVGMIETMRREQHTALVHTAAASNLGQMLHRVCVEDDIPLVNIVRRPEQEDLLRSAGAAYVCNSASPSFIADLTAALEATSATLAFDAIGGGTMASQILTCMEAAAGASTTGYSRYGSSTRKQVYIYGSLDRSPTQLTRNFGMAWGVSGWLLPNFLAQVGPETTDRMRRRVAAGLTTTFASRYSDEVSLAGMLDLDAIAVYGRQATGAKYLVDPSR